MGIANKICERANAGCTVVHSGVVPKNCVHLYRLGKSGIFMLL